MPKTQGVCFEGDCGTKPMRQATCPPGDAGVDAMFKAFSDVTRLRILHLLLSGEMCVGDLATIVGATQPRASQHLACLRAAGLVTCRREGLWSYYSLTRPTTTFHKKLLECLRHCFAEVPELQADDRRAAKLAKATPCCPPATPRRRTPKASR
ncbi:MAG: metalloregulator ArsR/SmtB family transcription factor [Pirellulales bacterium]